MKAISLWQPWASLWLSPRKVHETRHWATDHRGWLAVHAAKRFEKNHPTELASILRAQFGADWYKTLPTGALIGMVNIVDCIPTELYAEKWKCARGTRASRDNQLCGNFGPGRFAWERGAFRLLPAPIPYRGLQSMFNVPDDLMEAAA